MKAYRYVGKSVLRHDGFEKVTGQMRYTADRTLQNQCYGVLVTSSCAHGQVLGIEVSSCLQTPGVIRVFTAEDLPTQKISSHVWMDGIQDIEDEPLLTNAPKHYGDRIAVVIAETEEAAWVGASKVKIDYLEIKPVLSIKEALDPHTPPIHEYPNMAFDLTKASGDAEAAFKASDLLVEDIVKTPSQHHAAIEPHVCLAYMGSDQMLNIESPCQITFQVQMMVSKLSGIPQERIRVVKTTTGGSFGGKSQPVFEPICALLALQMERPVMLLTNREQCIASTRRRNSIEGHVKLGLSKEGVILGRSFDIVTDTGAYYGNGTAVSMAMMKKSFRLYDIQAQQYRARAVVTNTPVAGAARGYGSPQIHAVSEINLENGARLLGIDPLELRLKNIIKPHQEDPLGGPNLGNAGILECLLEGSRIFGWNEKYGRQRDTGRFRQGVGMAAIVHGNGYYGAYPEFTSIELRLTQDGGILVNTALHDLGCGTVTVTKQIIAEAMGIAIERVHVLEADTIRSPYDPTGTQACRVTFVCGESARLGALALRNRILSRASELLDISVEVLEIDGNCIVNGLGEVLMTLSEVAVASNMKYKQSLSVQFEYEGKANPGSYGANFAEVVVDTWTGQVEIVKIVAAHDIGIALNPEMVKGQIYGGIQMNLGFALCEEILLDSKGRLVTKNFNKYHLINAAAMPPIEVVLIEKGEPEGPYGAKSIGEACSVAAAPAVINAINHALGTRITELPATPERIVAALAQKEEL